MKKVCYFSIDITMDDRKKYFAREIIKKELREGEYDDIYYITHTTIVEEVAHIKNGKIPIFLGMGGRVTVKESL